MVKLVKNLTISNKISLLTWALVAASTLGVINSPLFGDDWPNSFNPYWAKYLYNETGVSAWLIDSYFGTQSWIERYGRLIPGGNLLSRFFILSDSILVYKFIQWLSILLLIYVSSNYIYKKVQRSISRNLIILLFILTLQFRHDFDPYIGFTFILIFVTILLILILQLIEEIQSPITKSKNKLVILFFLPIIAMLTYEYTFVLLPITILVILKSAKVTRIKERIYLILVTNAPVLAIGIYSLTVLRRERIIRTGTYEFNFDLGDYSHAVLSQMLAPIPHSQLIFGTAKAFNLNILIQSLVLIITLIIVKLVLSNLGNVRELLVSKKTLLTGIWFWMVPALLVGASGQWQAFLKPGNSYLPVIFQQFGIILILYFVVIKLINSKFYNSSLILRNFFVVVLAISLTISNINNQQFLVNDKYKENRFEILKIAIYKDLFRNVEVGGFIISKDTNDTHEVNRAVISILSGKDLTNIKTPNQIWDQDCIENLDCDIATDLKNQTSSMQLSALSGSEFTTIKRPYENGTYDYLGWRRVVDEQAPTYFMDALHYFNGAAIFTVSPVLIEGKRVYIDRNRGIIIWVSLDEKFPLLQKKIGTNSCVAPDLSKRERFMDGIVVSQQIVDSGVVDIKDSFSGELCQ
jgi:hypothetical protein